MARARGGRPQVTLKAAVTLDGRLAARTGDSKWITGPHARREAHRLRARHQAVLVGIGTVLLDDPRLTVRHGRGPAPRRVIVDRRLRTPPDARTLRGSLTPTLVFHGPRTSIARRKALLARGAELVCVPLSEHGLDFLAVLTELRRRNIKRVLVEGGERIHGTLLRRGLADRAAIFVAPRILGDPQAASLARVGPLAAIADGWRVRQPRLRRFGSDFLIEGPLVRGS